jgi:uncharacterized protein involved in type VI secretion and phage assembly
VLWLPEVGDEVLVSFLEGDLRRPVVLGGLYNGKDQAPFSGHSETADGKVETRGMRTTKGHTLVFEERDGGERIALRTADEKLAIVLDQAGGKVTIEADGDLELKATGSVTIKADGDVQAEASGKATLKGSQGVTIASPSSSVDITGRPIKLN